jgi:hypothetical protein
VGHTTLRILHHVLACVRAVPLHMLLCCRILSRASSVLACALIVLLVGCGLLHFNWYMYGG